MCSIWTSQKDLNTMKIMGITIKLLWSKVLSFQSLLCVISVHFRTYGTIFLLNMWYYESFLKDYYDFSIFQRSNLWWKIYSLTLCTPLLPLRQHHLSLQNLVLGQEIKENKNCTIKSQHIWNLAFEGNLSKKGCWTKKKNSHKRRPDPKG